MYTFTLTHARTLPNAELREEFLVATLLAAAAAPLRGLRTCSGWPWAHQCLRACLGVRVCIWGPFSRQSYLVARMHWCFGDSVHGLSTHSRDSQYKDTQKTLHVWISCVDHIASHHCRHNNQPIPRSLPTLALKLSLDAVRTTDNRPHPPPVRE